MHPKKLTGHSKRLATMIDDNAFFITASAYNVRVVSGGLRVRQWRATPGRAGGGQPSDLQALLSHIAFSITTPSST